MSCLYHLFDSGFGNISAHTVIDNTALGQISADDLACADHGRKIGRVIGVDRRGHRYDMELCLLELRFIRGKVYS